MQRLKAVLAVSALLSVCSVMAFAQSGSMDGTVSDSVGAVVPGAEITIRNVASNASRVVKASEVGAFSVTDLSAGVYDITVAKPSFKTFHAAGVRLTVAQAITVNAKLEPGTVSEEIEVRGDQIPAVELGSAQVSNLVDQTQLVGLPLITRNPYRLILLSPGTSQTNALGGITVNGARERNNNFLLDGVDNNDTNVPGGVGGVLNANPDSAQEFRVITNNFNAEFGRNTGAIVDVVTASGSNAFHGDAYEFGRWNGFGGARDWFNPASQGPMNPYERNQFGYSIGGPIRHDKTFFFFNQEFDRFSTALTSVATVPTATFKTGLFTYVDLNGNQVPVDLTQANTQNQNNNGLPADPTMQKILALYPNPTVSNGDGFSGTLFFPSVSRQNSSQSVAKIDHHFNDKHTLSLRFGYDHGTDPDGRHDDALPGGVGATAESFITEGLSANLTSALRPTLVNTLNFGWNHLYANFHCGGLNVLDSISKQDGTLDRFGNGRDYVMFPFTDFGCSRASDSQFRKTGTVSYGDGLSWVRGNHTFKFGFDFRDVGESGPNNFFSRRQLYLDPAFRFDPFYSPVTISGATAAVDDAAAAFYGLAVEDLNAEFFNKAGTRQPSDDKLFRAHEYDGYAQDTWRVRPNLTLTLGLRYQFDGVPYEQNANFSNLLTDPASFPVVFSIVGPGTGKQIYQPDYTGFEPRVGFSWDPWKNGKTVLRGAFGIFHDRVFGNLLENARGSPPFEGDYHHFPFDTLNGALSAGGNDAYNGIPGFVEQFNAIPTDASAPPLTVPDGSYLAPTVIDTHFRPSASNNWSFGIQHELPGRTTMDLTYVGSKGTHIYRDVDGNPPDPTLVNALVAFCSDPNNSFGCSPDWVSGPTLYNGGDLGWLPFNAVAHNALRELDYFRSVGNSSYNGLQFRIMHPFSHGLELQGSYTWSHALDDSSDPLAPALGNHTYPRNSRNLHQDWGNSDNDIRQIAVISYVWHLPFGRGQNYINTGAMAKILEGIQLSGITSLQTGRPFEVVSTTDSQRTGISAWAQLVGDPYAASTTTPSFGKAYFTNPNAFAEPSFGGPSNTARNQFFGPGYVNFDLALAKTIRFTERLQLETRFESYNLFNTPHFQNPNGQMTSPTFGVMTSTGSQPDGTTTARQIQVAMKLHF